MQRVKFWRFLPKNNSWDELWKANRRYFMHFLCWCCGSLFSIIIHPNLSSIQATLTCIATFAFNISCYRVTWFDSINVWHSRHNVKRREKNCFSRPQKRLIISFALIIRPNGSIADSDTITTKTSENIKQKNRRDKNARDSSRCNKSGRKI